jgi:hypothetical protein
MSIAGVYLISLASGRILYDSSSGLPRFDFPKSLNAKYAVVMMGGHIIWHQKTPHLNGAQEAPEVNIALLTHRYLLSLSVGYLV